MSLRFVHAADLHLDSPFTGIQSVAPPNVHARLIEATFAAYDRIIDLCIQERVDALLVAGDIYDGADRSLKAQLRFIDGLKRLDAAGIRSFVCHGNHDPLDGWQAKLRFPDSCHQFGSTVEAVPLDLPGRTRATVLGVSYPKREVTENLAAQFAGVARDGFSIGLLHANVGSNPEHAPYSPCTVDDLRATGIDYWALGHVHTQAVVSPRSPVVVYPGNPQGRHPTETSERGVYLVDVDDRGEVSLSFQDVSVVRWAKVTVSIDGVDSEQELLDLIDAAAAVAYQPAGRDVVYRLTLGGRGELYAATRKPDFPSTVQEHLNEEWASGSPFGWCERVEVATKPGFDREELRKADDFVGDLLKLVDAVAADPEQLKSLHTPLAPLFGHERARKYLKDALPDESELGRLVADAEARALDGLLGSTKQ